MPTAPNLTWVTDLEVSVGPAIELGQTPAGKRRVVPILGGSFNGPLLNGIILPGGADWQYTRSDSVAVLEARYTLKTSEGHYIAIVNTGFRHASEEILNQLLAGVPVPPDSYYFMTKPTFEASEPSLSWLNKSVFIAKGERKKDAVFLAVWQVG